MMDEDSLSSASRTGDRTLVGHELARDLETGLSLVKLGPEAPPYVALESLEQQPRMGSHE